MSKACREEVMMDEIKRAKKFENINFKLCATDMQRICPTSFAHG